MFTKLSSVQKDIAVVVVGNLLITAWTLLRFFTKAATFDMTGQQLLARQWLEGYADGSVTAPTNYIIKMALLYMPAELLAIPPHVALIGTTILVNVITFIAMYFVLKKLLQYFDVPVTGFFYGAMLWLATVAGSVFWIEFSNSRNVEVAAGLLVLYLGLLWYRQATARRGIFLVLAAGVTFFADPLQMYMVPAIVLGYAAIDSVVRKKPFTAALKLGGLFVCGGVLAALVTWAVMSATNVSFFAVSSLDQTLGVLHQPVTVAIQTAKNAVRLVAGTNEMGAWRQVVNITLVAALIGVTAWVAWQKHVASRVLLFCGVWAAVVFGVYVASGQPLSASDTSRYLILLAPALVVVFSLLGFAKQPLRRTSLAVLALVVAVNAASLLWVTANSWTHVLPGDASLKNKVAFAADAGYAYAYTSMDTAIPGTYLLGKGKPALLPVSCAAGQLRTSTLFYDKKVFTVNQALSVGEIPLILDGESISNHPYVCDAAAITAQLGDPLRQERLPSGELVLVYSPSTLTKLSP